ncbi:hypothetical protein D3H35_02565 [Cohnella faecalis]|uniref:Uncharacterized protein n=1 Tax=Cohnella faecalis TaxID=2315694 RepID=A0A398CWU1_9BACL|nr:hypothetical protein D3H35_02565 [Cohnella faecalis]
MPLPVPRWPMPSQSPCTVMPGASNATTGIAIGACGLSASSVGTECQNAHFAPGEPVANRLSPSSK